MRILFLLVFLAFPAIGLAAPPNIVLIFADDLGITDLGCYGRKEHQTPHLDRLAQEGIRFTTSYAGASICSPNRAALLTGLAPARVRITTFLPGRPDAPSQKLLHPKIEPHLPADLPTLPGLLKQRGYVTASFGKWHLGGKGHQPTDHGFDSHYAGRANTIPSDTEGGKGEYDLTAQAIDFIKKPKDKPFFVYLSHNTPHIPYSAKAKLIQQNQKAFEPTYAALIQSLDDTVGLLLSALKEQKLEENTLVIFTSDNGGLHVPELKHERITHNKPFRAGKGYLYEGGLRVPLILRWPGTIPPGREIDTPVTAQDLLPTLVEIAGGTPPKVCDGVSLVSLAQGKPLPERSLFWHQPHYTNQGGRPGSAIRAGKWKLIQHFDDNTLELFDLSTDLGESNNLAKDQPALANDLLAELAAWRVTVKAQGNRLNPAFEEKLFKRLYVEFDPSRYDPTDPKQEAAALAWRAAMDAVTKKPR